MRALVTGGAGFIGSNLVDALLARGDEVVVVDNLATGKRENLDDALTNGATLHETDIRDAQAVEEIAAAAKPDAIFHMAAQIDVRKSAADPAHDARVNVEGTINVLQAARAAEVPRFVNTSTGGAIYGEGRQIPAPETHPNAPEAPYGQSKYAAEGYCALYERLHGLSTVILRYGNVFGARQDPLGEAGVVAIFCGRLVEGKRPIVFGDGEQSRDFTYVDNAVQATALAMDAVGVAGQVFNVASGERVTVNRLLAELGDLLDSDVEPVHMAPRPGEVRHSLADCSRACQALGYEPRIGLREGLWLTVEHQRNQALAPLDFAAR